MASPTAAIVTVGTELTTGLRIDTNGPEVARELRGAGYSVGTLISIPDDESALANALGALTAAYDLVVVTGGLGPTHDDITRQAASRALRRPLLTDERLAEWLSVRARSHTEPEAAAQILRQADILQGARVLSPTTGTAPGQVVACRDATLVLLPGPPHEMRPMLASFLAGRSDGIAPVRLRCALITESDAQVRASRALEAHPGVDLTVLAAPAEVEVILFEHGAGAAGLASATAAVHAALGDVCYSDDGSSLAATVVRLAREVGARIAVAESCTGGLVASSITDVPGASDIFVAGMVAYANQAKVEGLSVDPALLACHGAVSAEVAVAMAEGIRDRYGATLTVATTGIAGPGGGTDAKPVGLVWFGRAGSHADTVAEEHRFPGDRTSVRTRATVFALDWLRRALVEP